MNYFDILLAKKLNGGGGGDITVESLSVTQNGTYTAPQGKAYSPVTVEVQPPENSYQLKSITTPTSLATFNASAMPMPTLKVSVEAKQDLHGYDKPWPAGGGKNKLPMVLNDIKSNNLGGTWSGNDFTGNGVTFTILTDESDDVIGVKVTGTASADATLYLYGGTTSSSNGIVFSESFIGSTEVAGSSSTVRGIIWGTNGAYIDGSETTFNAMTVYGFGIRVMSGYSIPSGGVTFKPMLRLATSASGFAPYSNICPIEGWDEAKVENHGENLFESATFTQGTISGSGTPQDSNTRIRTSSFILVPSGTYKIKSSPELYGTIRVYSSNSYTSYVSGESLISWTLLNGYEFTLTSDRYMIIVLSKSGTEQIDIVPSDVNKIVVSSAIDTTTISLPQTVYGGELDVVNGILKITDGYIASYNGETLPSTWISSMDVYAEGTTPTTGAEVCYELATPTTVSITPTLIKSLNGINNLSVDCGDVIEGEYFKALGGA